MPTCSPCARATTKQQNVFAAKIITPGGGTLRISGCGCAARTLEPLPYTRASFSWILLPYTRVNSWFPWSSQLTGQFREK